MRLPLVLLTILGNSAFIIFAIQVLETNWSRHEEVNENVLWLHNLTVKLVLVSKNKEMIYFIHIGINLITVANVLNGSLDAFLGLRPHYTAQRDIQRLFFYQTIRFKDSDITF